MRCVNYPKWNIHSNIYLINKTNLCLNSIFFLITFIKMQYTQRFKDLFYNSIILKFYNSDTIYNLKIPFA